ncbi:hypothetical protein [Clostridium beijerinckii]|uniref:hypothetical protein n=1 Tax=Clostridium beijerinckii TaxID=1520 RepID=UPI0002F56C86|nr:hypothetical protein [Clostridium beijerinckii]
MKNKHKLIVIIMLIVILIGLIIARKFILNNASSTKNNGNVESKNVAKSTSNAIDDSQKDTKNSTKKEVEDVDYITDEEEKELCDIIYSHYGHFKSDGNKPGVDNCRTSSANWFEFTYIYTDNLPEDDYMTNSQKKFFEGFKEAFDKNKKLKKIDVTVEYRNEKYRLLLNDFTVFREDFQNVNKSEDMKLLSVDGFGTTANNYNEIEKEIQILNKNGVTSYTKLSDLGLSELTGIRHKQIK